MTFEEIVQRFEATPSGDSHKAKCPAHEDFQASLSISRNGHKTLLNCFAGCSTEAVVRAKGLAMVDLFENRNGRSPIVATYDYHDRKGVLRYRKVRTAAKAFWFEKADGKSGWITKKNQPDKPVMGGVTRLLYRLNEIRDCETFITEGEKDADRLHDLGLSVTTNDGGASEDQHKPKWTESLTKQLKAADVSSVICLPDNDDAGRAHMQAVAQSCTDAGIPAVIIELPDLPVKGDVSDWLDAGHTIEELWALYACATPYATPTAAPPALVLAAEPRTLAQVHEAFSRWFGAAYDLDAIDAVLAAAAVEKLKGDPLWLLLVSGPGNTKTETVQTLNGVGAITVSTITSEGALLSASPKREKAKDATGGLLRRVGDHGILVIKDVTSILSMQSNTRTGVLAALREIHDGHWARNVGTDGGKTLEWAGRIVIIGAVTTAWDTAHTVISTMGDRYVLLRMDSHLGRQSAGEHAIRNTGSEEAMRKELAEVVAGVLGTVDPEQAATLTAAEQQAVLAAANVTTLCRTAVEYDFHGNPIDAHAPEMPTRFAKELTQLVRGAVAVGMGRKEALRLALRCARDSMPPLRLAILEYVAANPGSQVNDVREGLDKPWSTVKKQLMSLQLLKVLTCQESGAPVEGEDGEVKTKREWRYSVDDLIDVAALQWDVTLRAE